MHCKKRYAFHFRCLKTRTKLTCETKVWSHHVKNYLRLDQCTFELKHNTTMTDVECLETSNLKTLLVVNYYDCYGKREKKLIKK